MPAISSFEIEVSEKMPYSTIRMLGGISEPSVPAAATTPAASPLS